MSARYEIVKYRPEHKPLVAELQKQLWSSDASLNTRYLEWKYERVPGPREPLIYLALDGQEAVGMRGFHEARLEAGGPAQTFPVLIAGDAVVSPAHRNRGLVTRIMNVAYADVADRDYRYLVSVGGANRVNVFGLLTLGWKSAGGLKPLGLVTRRARASHDLSRTMNRLPLLWRLSQSRLLSSADQRKPFRHLDAAASVAGLRAGQPITVDSRARVDAIVGLIERLGHDGRIRYVRDREYLAWRFGNPMSEYRFIYWERERLDGYLVLGRRSSDLGGWDRVYIADLEASDMRVRAELLSAAITLGRFPELVTWTGTLSGEETALLHERGFAPVDAEDTARGCPCILVRGLREGPGGTEWLAGGRRMLDINDWDIRVLYSMRG